MTPRIRRSIGAVLFGAALITTACGGTTTDNAVDSEPTSAPPSTILAPTTTVPVDPDQLFLDMVAAAEPRVGELFDDASTASRHVGEGREICAALDNGANVVDMAYGIGRTPNPVYARLGVSTEREREFFITQATAAIVAFCPQHKAQIGF